MDDMLKYEKKLYNDNIDLVAGIDEVGRGPLVGPVVAACVILPKNYKLEGLTDSKKLSEKKRNTLFEIIKKDALAIGIGVVDNKIIDKINILQASKLAMQKAISDSKITPKHLLIDGNQKIDTNISQTTIVKGDSKSLSIAAASVIAKVTRDEMMYELDKLHPEYGFASHKGYPTKKHLKSVKENGVLPNYRFTFGPIRDLINNVEGDVVEESNEKQII